jgi:hypothetical protein
MKAYKLYAAPILTLIGGVVALVLLASSMGSSVEQRARSLADRAFGEAQNNWRQRWIR